MAGAGGLGVFAHSFPPQYKSQSHHPSVIPPPQKSSLWCPLGWFPKRFLATFRDGKLAPPCRSYQQLITLREFQPFLDDMGRATAESDIKDVRTRMTPFKSALNDLVACLKTANTAMTRGLREAVKIQQSQSDVGVSPQFKKLDRLVFCRDGQW